MNKELTMISERVDDIPLLVTQMKHMGMIELLDAHFTVHGNWQGLSLGALSVGWLTHILSEADHRMNHVQLWVEKCVRTLSSSLGQGVRELDFADDRLAAVLHILSDDECWASFEQALNQQLLRVYALRPRQVRLDTTTSSGYWEVTEEGLFQFGHSKDRRPDGSAELAEVLPQVKVMLAVLDPLGMPLVTDIVQGQRADDPLYKPAIERVRDSITQRGVLYVGDSKMGARETRGLIQQGGDYYLTPLSAVQVSAAEFERYLRPVVRAGGGILRDIYRQDGDGKQTLIARGYERTARIAVQVDGQPQTWTERRLVVRSLRQAHAAQHRLQKRLQHAQDDLLALNKRGRGKTRYPNIVALWQVADTVLDKYRVRPFMRLRYTLQVQRRTVRGYGPRPTRVVEATDTYLAVEIDRAAVERHLARQGWRVYATNAPVDQLPLGQAILAYRGQYIVERGCGRLKGKPLSLSPMYVERDDHATGLIRLLSLGLRVLTLLEFQVRRQLAAEQGVLTGLYAGNPKRATARPTTERLLEAFEHITMTMVQLPDRQLSHLTPLSPLQQRILNLLGFSETIYTRLGTAFSKPP